MFGIKSIGCHLPLKRFVVKKILAVSPDVVTQQSRGVEGNGSILKLESRSHGGPSATVVSAIFPEMENG